MTICPQRTPATEAPDGALGHPEAAAGSLCRCTHLERGHLGLVTGEGVVRPGGVGCLSVVIIRFFFFFSSFFFF